MEARSQTAAQQQYKKVQEEREQAEIERKNAEIAAAQADLAYKEKMGLSTSGWVRLQTAKICTGSDGKAKFPCYGGAGVIMQPKE